MLRKFRVEAKDVGALKQSNEALKAEIEMLRAKALEETEHRNKIAEQKAKEKESELLSRAEAAKKEEVEKMAAKLAQALEKIEEERRSHEAALLEAQRSKSRDAANSSIFSPISDSYESLEHELAQLRSELEMERALRAQAEDQMQEALRLLSEERRERLRLEASNHPTPVKAVSDSSPSSEVAAGSTWQDAGITSPVVTSHSTTTSLTSIFSSIDQPSDVEASVPLLKAEKEKSARLEEEVVRLRRISLDLTTQVDTLRRNLISATASSSSTSTSSSISATTVSSSLSTTNAAATNVALVSNAERRKDEKPERVRNRRYSVATSTFNRPPIPARMSPTVVPDPSKPIVPGFRIKTPNKDQFGTSYSMAEDLEEEEVETPVKDTVTGGSSNGGEEKDENNGHSEATLVHTPSTLNREHDEAVTKFTHNLEIFRFKLHQGVMIHLWQNSDIDSKAETRLRLSPNNLQILFEDCKAKRRSMFSMTSLLENLRKLEIAPIRVVDIFECLPGGDVRLLNLSLPADIAKAEQTLLTLVTKSEGSTPRSLVMQLKDKEERNFILSGIRMMQNSMSGLPAPTISMPLATSSNTSRLTAREAVPSSNTSHKTVRRMSMRDAVIEETKNSSTSSASTRASLSSSHDAMRQQQAMSAANLRGEMGTSGQQQQHQLRGQLQDERQSYERLRTQTLLLTNELQERDDEIASLKKREQVYEQTLKAKEKMYDQDVHVRMQLGKRLESVLLDKEELSETIESLTEQLRQQSLQLSQLQASLPPPPNITTSTTPSKTNDE